MKKVLFILFSGICCLGSLPGKAQIGLQKEHSFVFSQPDSLRYLNIQAEEGRLFILANLNHSSSKTYVLVMNASGKLLALTDTPRNFNKLYLSCDDIVYAGNDDTVFQVKTNSNTVYFDNPQTTTAYETLMKNCLFLDDGVLFKQVERPASMSSVLYAIYRDETGKKVESVVFVVQDSLAVKKYTESGTISNIHSKGTDQRSSPRNTKKSTQVDTQMDRMKKGNQRTVSTSSFVRIAPGVFHLPVKLLMTYHDENFYVLDYTNGSIACINRFLSERRMIDLKNFSLALSMSDTYCDRVTGDFYFLERANGDCVLKRYDHLSGKLMFSRTFPELVHTEKLVIYNNRVYFLIQETGDSPLPLLKAIELE